ncbi:DUF6059 family protein [Streptomyces sp. R21]|uniref:DUF6059 family protein n=1 Tax=Streptomyces sp. R21 TaxID=3238627 RepID=A0AB39PLL0_9ACTN
MGRRVWIWVRGEVKGLGPALGALGVSFGALLPLGWLWESELRPDDGGGESVGSGPGPGHPERLVAGVPLTPAEEQLWSQLVDR